MADLKDINPFARAANVLSQRKKDIDEAAGDKTTVAAAPDAKSDAAEEAELTKSASRLRDYRIRKNIGDSTPAETRLFTLQEKRAKSYKKGTKKVSKSGVAKLHKGEAVLNKKQAKKFRASKGSARLLGAGKYKVKKGAKRG
jgi:hypothetical protein